MARRKLIAANWKMNGDLSLCASMQNAINQCQISEDVAIVIAPPYTLIAALSSSDRLSIGAQNVSQFDQGAYTGELSTTMLKNAGCEYVIVGHSERRELFGETNQIVAEKFVKIARAGLKPILCVGESLSEREAGVTNSILQEQIQAVISCSSSEDWMDAVIAYEPVWAIGTGKTATPEMAQEAHHFLRELLQLSNVTKVHADNLRILYGGSMKPDNAAELLSQDDIDGGLVGGASLKPDSFTAILSAA